MEWIRPLAQACPSHAGVLAASGVDELAALAALDLAREEGCDVHPFETGVAYYIETLTLYWVGRVVRVSPCWLELEDASCVMRTGRKGTLFREKSFDHGAFPREELKPRTEYVGAWSVAVSAITGFRRWDGELPRRSI